MRNTIYVLVLIGCLTVLVAEPTTDTLPSPAETFVELLSLRIELEPTPCPDEFQETSGDPLCGVIGFVNPRREAERVAIRLAGRGAPVLDVDFNDDLPLHRYAQLPGFEPLAKVPGFDRFAYLLGQQRIAIWVERETTDMLANGERRRMVLRIEPLDGPFPDYLPADERSGE